MHRALREVRSLAHAHHVSTSQHMFSKTYELSLTRTYVSRWGMVQAVRELIQNALDSESPFAYQFAREDDEGHESFALSLTSEFTTLQPQTLLLGATSKADSKDSIGSFGEGYKIALLVLTRLGYDVEMRNGALLWRPRFRHSKQFGEELLVIDEAPLPDKKNKGLTFVVHGLSEADVAEIRASCLQMQEAIGEMKTTEYGDILLERPHKLYIGGLFVCETELAYGYNVKPEHLRLERDRQTVDGFDLKNMTKQMWFATAEWDRIARMIEEKVPDVEYAEYSSPPLVKEACYRLFREQHPGAVVAKDQAELKALVAQGMQRVVVVSSSTYSNVRYSASYQAQPTVRVSSPHEQLEMWFATSKYHMHDRVRSSFRKLLEASKNWRVQ